MGDQRSRLRATAVAARGASAPPGGALRIRHRTGITTAIVAGFKQGWAFAWRSLLAGELLVFIANRPALGAQMEILRQLNDATGVMAVMIAIFAVGVIADGVFGRVDRVVRRRWGVVES
jgi:ABC-type nitrate/sulfonate/bicarbonate transport system permease component